MVGGNRTWAHLIRLWEVFCWIPKYMPLTVWLCVIHSSYFKKCSKAIWKDFLKMYLQTYREIYFNAQARKWPNLTNWFKQILLKLSENVLSLIKFKFVADVVCKSLFKIPWQVFSLLGLWGSIEVGFQFCSFQSPLKSGFNLLIVVTRSESWLFDMDSHDFEVFWWKI